MSETNEPIFFEVTPRQLSRMLPMVLEAGLVPFIQGSPGIGKSALTKNTAKAMNYKVIDHRLSTSAPEDLSGLPSFQNGKATFMPFDIFPTEDTPLPEGYDGWVLFLDEFNSAAKSVQAAAYKLILDRMVGQHKLHEKVAIVAAGNHATDRAIVNPLGTAMQSRLVHFKLVHNVDEWLEDVAFAENYDSRIIAYITWKPDALFDFRPDHNELTFCCPRTWEFMNRLIKGKTFNIVKDKNNNDIYEMDMLAPMFAGTITSGTATGFIQFTKVFQNLPDIGQILALPNATPIPGDKALQWATVVHLFEKSDENTFEPVSQYVSRFSTEFRIVYFRMIIARKPELKAHPQYRKMIGELSRYLND